MKLIGGLSQRFLMASSDDEEVVVPQSVANFHFVDIDGVPISFSRLPIIMNDDETPEAPIHQVSVRGTTDGGLQSVFKDIVAWKLRLDGDDPEVSVLTKDNKWLKLERPKKSYEECIKATLVIMHLLHFSKKNPEASVKNFWEHLRQISSSFNERPSMDEFKHLMEIIKMFLENDTILAKSQILLTFVKNPGEAFAEDFQNNLGERPFFIDDELENGGIDDGEDSEEESDLFDSVCSICDNGGELLCCEGRCLRSFHATKRAGSDSDCASLGLTRVQVEAMQNFLCKNCQFRKHQCFACGKLGSSDKSANAEVFSCVSATCGRFYHPKCVADLLFPENKIEATGLGKRIADGESFTCSVHRCCVCKKVENKEVEELQFAICRRCPKAYHRKCLPRKIAFEDDEDQSIIQRAWEGLLPNRILIYCLKHEIDEELGTPYRDHIIFPELPEKKREMDIQKLKLKKIVLASGKITGNLQTSNPTKRLEKFPTADSDDYVLTGGKTSTQKVLNSQIKLNVPAKDVRPAVKKIESKDFPKASLSKVGKPNFDSEKSLSGNAKVANSTAVVLGKLINTVPKILPEIKKEVLALVEQESSLLTQDDIRKRLSKPSTYGTSVGQIDKSITLGKIEGAIEAVRTALEKLEKGGNVEDAKAVCEPEILKRLIKWHVKLKVYLAPILHGARYSSFGRHFTKLDKLQEIVDKLQWYVQDDDMVVDFCCGANEFSILMKEKLDAAGKKCFFKNYDILQAKNDFNFEMRDWMTVRSNELPSGSKLIMGLNPPFGLNARLANQFIDKALTFKPKLLVLIVPQETRSLNTKNPPYDLIWEDRGTLSGKSFYLPGSIDVYEKQIEQWNMKPPPLYLWSRQDWTSKHKVIAAVQGHRSRMSSAHAPADSQVNGNGEDSPPPVAASIKNSRERDSAAHEERESEMAEARMQAERREEAKIEAADDKKRPENKETAEARIQAEKRIEAKREASDDKKRPENKETAEARIQAEKREEAKREASDDKKRPENKEAAVAPSPQNESTREAHSKKPRLEESSTKGSAQAGKEAGKMTAVAEHQSKKRKSSEPNKDSSNNHKKILGEQKLQQKKQEGGNEPVELPCMSISPPDRRNSPHNNEAQKSPFVRESSHNVALPYTGPDGIHRRYYSTNSAAERDGMYANSSSPLRRSGVELYGRDYPSDDRFRGYSSSMDAYNQSSSPFARSGYRTSPDTSLRMPQFRNYSLPGGDGYSLPHNRNYGVPEEHTIGSRYSSSPGQQPGLYPLPSTYRLSGSAEASVMNRYAPRLDEMGLHSRPQSIPLHGSIRHGDIPPDSFGFASAPPPFPKSGSFGGWIDD